MPCYPAAPAADTFSTSRTAFDALVVRPSTQSSLSLEYAEVEDLLDNDGTELLRCLLQDHFDLRAALEQAEPVIGSDGIERPHRRRSGWSLNRCSAACWSIESLCRCAARGR